MKSFVGPLQAALSLLQHHKVSIVRERKAVSNGCGGRVPWLWQVLPKREHYKQWSLQGFYGASMLANKYGRR